MIERPGLLLRWFYRIFFHEIGFPQEGVARIRSAAENATVVYVCRTLSYIDYLYFSYALWTHRLPLSRWTNGLRVILVQSVWNLVRGVFRLWRERRRDETGTFAGLVESGQATTLFLKRPQVLLDHVPIGFRGPYAEELLRIERERRAGRGDVRPIVFVPLVLVWGRQSVRAGSAQRSLVDLVFGEREAPGRLRAVWNFLRNFRSSRVLVGEPLALSSFLDEEAAGELEPEALASRLRWRLAGRIDAELRAVMGPTRKGAARLCEEILRSRRLVQEARTIAAEEKLAPRELERRLRSSLKEIAADPKPWTFRLARESLTWVWNRIYDGLEVDLEGLERVREAARKGPLILVPSHKSHVDYLVISHYFSTHEIVPPLIAAGANLSFWPIGVYFRAAGAFFLRRTFKGDRLYAAAFRAYVRKILREGYSVEFFIEGGRSRTGKLLAPKLGLLGMMVEAALDDDGRRARHAQIVPISIGYEKVIEEKSYARELAGGEKKTEDVRGLLQATRVLKGRYGRLNIQFAEPFQLGEVLRDYGAIVAWDDSENVVVPAEEPARRVAIQRLAHRIIYGINRVTAITPTALVSSVLLGSGRRGVSRGELLKRAEFLIARARQEGGRFSEALLGPEGRLDLDSVDRAIELLAGDNDLQIRGAAGEEIYTIPDERRPRLAYYRNNAIHLYVPQALLCYALASLRRDGAGPILHGELRGRTLAVSRLLKLEFGYRVGETFDEIFEGTVARLSEAGVIRTSGGFVELPPEQAAERALLAGFIVDFVESYWVTARAVAQLGGAVASRELLRRIQDHGDKLFFTGEITRREACVRANYQNAVDYLRDRGALIERDKRIEAVAAELGRVSEEIAALRLQDAER